MNDMRKQDPRKYTPSLGSGDGVSAGANGGKEASKDSLTGKNSVTEYKPGKLPQGGGALGGKNASV